MTGDGGEYLRPEDLKELGDDSLPSSQFLDGMNYLRYSLEGGRSDRYSPNLHSLSQVCITHLLDIFFPFSFFFWFLEIRSHYVAQNSMELSQMSLKLLIPLSQPPEYWACTVGTYHNAWLTTYFLW